MVLKGYVKRVAELKKKTKEQLINSIIEKERRRDDKLSHLVNQYMNYHDMLERSRIENKDLDKKIAVLKTEIMEKDKHIGQLTGYLKITKDDLRKAIEDIKNQSKNITDMVLKKFNEIKIKIIQELVDEKVQLIREKLRKKKDEELFEIFGVLGVSRERLIEIIKKGAK